MKDLKNIYITLLVVCMGVFMIIIDIVTGYIAIQAISERIIPFVVLFLTLFFLLTAGILEWVPMMYRLLKKWHPLFKKQGE